MRFDSSFIDELLARFRASDIIGRHVDLKKAGREFRGLSPFNAEKTPSFFVNDEKGMYFDFSSGKSGNIINFLMENQNLSFVETVEMLASEAGMTLPDYDPVQEQQAKSKKALSYWTQLASRWFAKQLRSDMGARARYYLEQRRFDPALWQDFDIGFAPNDGELILEYLKRQGASDNDLMESGLATRRGAQEPLICRFRDRIMFPITNEKKMAIGFGGRALNKNAKAKYLNSPECALFQKSRLLYRYSYARDIGREFKTDTIFVAEGYLDVIAFERIKLPAVAALGTAFTDDQFRLLWKSGQKIVFCYDGDAAGQRASARTAEKLLPHLQPGREISFLTLPEGKDPDDILREDGITRFKEITQQNRSSVFDILWRREYGTRSLTSPDHVADLQHAVRSLVHQISDKDMKSAYQTAFDQRIGSILGTQLSHSGKTPPQQQSRRYARSGKRENPKISSYLRACVGQSAGSYDLWQDNFRNDSQAIILALLLREPFHLNELDEILSNTEFEDEEMQQLKNKLLACWFALDIDDEQLLAKNEEWTALVNDMAFRRLSEIAAYQEDFKLLTQNTDANSKIARRTWIETALDKLQEKSSLVNEKNELLKYLAKNDLDERTESRLRELNEKIRAIV